MNKRIAVLIAAALLFSPAASFAKARAFAETAEVPQTFTKTKTLAGGINIEFSLVTLTKYDKDVEEVFKYTFSETERIAELFNSPDQNSDLAKIAESAGQSPVRVSKETLVLAQHAKEIADWTRGAFEPVRGNGTYHNLKINKSKSTIYLNKAGLSLDLKGILEGFMADLFIRAAHYANLEDAFVRINGVSRAMGYASYGPWQVVLEGTGQGTAKHGMTVTISNYSAATVGGEYFAPAINPRSGKPIESPFYSVTVLTKRAATAQGIATSVYAMGPKEGLGTITDLGIRAIFAYKDGRVEKVGKW
jgi:thiamine biosynthesis lipoprotein ApbE